jgi:hypothetical protein
MLLLQVTSSLLYARDYYANTNRLLLGVKPLVMLFHVL